MCIEPNPSLNHLPSHDHVTSSLLLSYFTLLSFFLLSFLPSFSFRSNPLPSFLLTFLYREQRWPLRNTFHSCRIATLDPPPPKKSCRMKGQRPDYLLLWQIQYLVNFLTNGSQTTCDQQQKKTIGLQRKKWEKEIRFTISAYYELWKGCNVTVLRCDRG